MTLDDAGATLNIAQGATLALSATSQMLAVTAGTLDVSGTLIDISSTGIDIVVGSGGGAIINSGVITSAGTDGVFATGSEVINNSGTIDSLGSLANGLQFVDGFVTNGSANNTTAIIAAGNTGADSSSGASTPGLTG